MKKTKFTSEAKVVLKNGKWMVYEKGENRDESAEEIRQILLKGDPNTPKEILDSLGKFECLTGGFDTKDEACIYMQDRVAGLKMGLIEELRATLEEPKFEPAVESEEDIKAFDEMFLKQEEELGKLSPAEKERLEKEHAKMHKNMSVSEET